MVNCTRLTRDNPMYAAGHCVEQPGEAKGRLCASPCCLQAHLLMKHFSTPPPTPPHPSPIPHPPHPPHMHCRVSSGATWQGRRPPLCQPRRPSPSASPSTSTASQQTWPQHPAHWPRHYLAQPPAAAAAAQRRPWRLRRRSCSTQTARSYCLPAVQGPHLRALCRLLTAACMAATRAARQQQQQG